MKTVDPPSVPMRKHILRRLWAKSGIAERMSVFEFGQFLISLDEAQTHEEITQLEDRWSRLGPTEENPCGAI